MSVKLFTTQIVDGQSAEAVHSGGAAAFVGWGTFGTGTLKLQISPDGGTTWIDVPLATMTANGMVSIELPVKALVRADLTGSTSASVDATLL